MVGGYQQMFAIGHVFQCIAITPDGIKLHIS